MHFYKLSDVVQQTYGSLKGREKLDFPVIKVLAYECGEKDFDREDVELRSIRLFYPHFLRYYIDLFFLLITLFRPVLVCVWINISTTVYLCSMSHLPDKIKRNISLFTSKYEFYSRPYFVFLILTKVYLSNKCISKCKNICHIIIWYLVFKSHRLTVISNIQYMNMNFYSIILMLNDLCFE